MIQHLLRKILSTTLAISFLIPSIWAAETIPSIELQDLALPSDLKELPRSSGAVYYSNTTKNKPLMPVHIWGEVSRPGLHYIPVDTKLVKGLSFAGGGSSLADLEEVTVNRSVNGKIKKSEFDLTEGGNAHAQEFTLQSGDTVYLPRDTYREDRNFYVSLVGVAATIITSILVIKRIEEINK
jgi:hypothetical protein